VLLASGHQRDDQEFGAVEDALDLHPEEFVVARRQGFGRRQAFFLDQRMHLLAQPAVGDADEAPRLHEADRRRQVRGLDQPFDEAVRQRLGRVGRDEVAHVAALAQGAPQRLDFGVGVAVRFVGHGSAVQGGKERPYSITTGSCPEITKTIAGVPFESPPRR
jgi:hypothetical protein